MKSSLLAILVVSLLLFGGLRSVQAASGGGGRPGFGERPELGQSSEMRERAATLRRHREMVRQRKSRDLRAFPNEVIVTTSPEVGQVISVVPPQILQETSPASIEQAPPAIPQPSYYWYYCGPGEQGPSPRERGAHYCLGGIRPSVRARPGPGKPIQQFAANEADCRARANAEAGTLPGVAASGAGDGDLASATTVQGRYDISYQRCMVAKGYQIPAAVGPPPPSTPLPYLPPPPPPPRAFAPSP